MKEKKFDCYKCKYRGEIPGDCHSCCHHPTLGNVDSNMFGALMQLMEGTFSDGIKKLNIRGNAHGIRSGWFMWPANFDPLWLENCDGFAPKEEPKLEVKHSDAEVFADCDGDLAEYAENVDPDIGNK